MNGIGRVVVQHERADEKLRERAHSSGALESGWKRGTGAASVLSWVRADSGFLDREKSSSEKAVLPGAALGWERNEPPFDPSPLMMSPHSH
ncbi:hypothetical protein AALO_G00210580 [Alosa alosa]|uniref:Uncharacterized protein n=1 Tax=Alosa alosa TaxID=278164 RepID=A0AAV6FZI8_9TELE|nr:hypothetical protein AALO_G00210580 [Alosa alosa]